LAFHAPYALEKSSSVVQPLVYTNTVHLTSLPLSKEASLKFKGDVAEGLEYTASLVKLTKERYYELLRNHPFLMNIVFSIVIISHGSDFSTIPQRPQIHY
jgi:hypothetical protein